MWSKCSSLILLVVVLFLRFYLLVIIVTEIDDKSQTVAAYPYNYGDVGMYNNYNGPVNCAPGQEIATADLHLQQLISSYDANDQNANPETMMANSAPATHMAPQNFDASPPGNLRSPSSGIVVVPIDVQLDQDTWCTMIQNGFECDIPKSPPMKSRSPFVEGKKKNFKY